MATEATFTVPSDEFPLGGVFNQLPGATVDLERIIPDSDVVIPYFWVRGVATDDIETAFNDHRGVRDIRFVDSVEDEYLLRVEWMADYEGILTTLAETGVPLLEATGTTSGRSRSAETTGGHRRVSSPLSEAEYPDNADGASHAHTGRDRNRGGTHGRTGGSAGDGVPARLLQFTP